MDQMKAWGIASPARPADIPELQARLHATIVPLVGSAIRQTLVAAVGRPVALARTAGRTAW